MYQADTIVAIATPPGNGGIGILRLSGPDSIKILEKVWSEGKNPSEFEQRRLYLGKIRSLRDRNENLDEVFAVWMKAPSSFTGEDVVEVQAHGGYLLLEILLENFVHAGARLAEPGEFTKRAFLNGRLDLAQAEAVADLIHAASHEAARLAERQLSGTLSQYVRRLKNSLTVLRAQMEAMIDFPEDEDVQILRYDEVEERVEQVRGEIKKLLETYREGRAFREGVRVAIVGKPNVGKSSLLNALLREERAIVHETPGTTRDVIEEVLEIKGLPVRFVDTAGIRRGEEPIETEGIRRTRERISKADLVLAVFDSSRPWEREDDEVLEAVSGREALHLCNKMDLPLSSDDQKVPGTFWSTSISAKTGEGIDLLKEKIFSHFIRTPSRLTDSNEVILTTARHKISLERGLEMLHNVLESSKKKMSLEFLAADLQIAANCLAEITGEITNDEILGEIFSKFCVGK